MINPAVLFRVLRDVHDGKEPRTESDRRAAGYLVLAGCVRRLRTKHKITAAGSKLLEEHDGRNRPVPPPQG